MTNHCWSPGLDADAELTLMYCGYHDNLIKALDEIGHMLQIILVIQARSVDYGELIFCWIWGIGYMHISLDIGMLSKRLVVSCYFKDFLLIGIRVYEEVPQSAFPISC